MCGFEESIVSPIIPFIVATKFSMYKSVQFFIVSKEFVGAVEDSPNGKSKKISVMN
tara:strand:+ start:322 stop:489 length:168 start_codon:yes stop_codon:yes gene_type:complete